MKDGLRAGGLDVVDLGMTPTPLVYFSLYHLDVDGGIQVTGSHNPPDHNGFKICVGKVSIYGEADPGAPQRSSSAASSARRRAARRSTTRSSRRTRTS